ncbi:hypothetical protein K0M31_011195 [Melipona bicolor]|uniref:MANSC domain-containing protein n=1 Tax=Melipona bicolor TaxID=60889 RepID=A0AA40G924_9HYME|nr:hypothetical protein K0M31_011195 [Melipona bicolor]
MMFYKNLQVLFHFFTVLYVFGETSMRKNEKRISLRNNYQMCLDAFKIHEDKIIRTQESLDMGAKYLKEFDVNSREECLKFCCDTESCDVFIFEEKKPGSCYLFQCGPLHDFKCKFTSHANYSSAVRSNYNTQHSNSQLEKESRISQQEHELKSLRKLVDPAPVEYSFTESSVKLIATLAPKLPLTTSPPIKQVCTRNQYECRSSGDCIAVYNVCDGIPQCADGSDEAADACPTEKPTIFPSVIQGAPPPLSPYQQMIDRHKSYAPLYPHIPEINSWKLPSLAQQMIPPHLLYPARQMEGAPGYQWDYQPMYDQNKGIYNSYREQGNLNPPEQDQLHIFNHKGPSVIGEKEPDGGTYLDVKHPYTSYFLSSNRGLWPNNQVYPSPSPSPISNVQQKQIIETERNVITTTPPCDTSHEQKDVPLKSQESEKVGQQGDKRIHEKEISQNNKQNILKNETLKFTHVQAKETKEHKSVIVIKHHSREHGRNTIIAEHLKQANENEVLKPRGAVISLALGLAITAITATLIACRLRVVQKRGRRHGPYAHDADYLVNGMYL